MLAELIERFTKKKPSVKVLVVCMENVCRSPMAEGALKQAVAKHGLAAAVEVKSAGTLVSQPGRRPDVRAIKVAQARGIDITTTRSKIIKPADFTYYDYILAADKDVLSSLQKINKPDAYGKILLLMSFVKNPDTLEIPDPYFGNIAGFERVMDLVERAAEEMVSTLISTNSIHD
ncbi:low molecular weight protein-tyrosine-phosphatase [Neptunomonas qingdaonensis]|uniref:protein-tyrosine-phosphatase n=1 Tax=Neptunomonas qingdaonensis TaxID=1045558 RepID=A0A1I2MTE4_9GAMM|nr:protein-tyrosine phosphatase [Neptunomonas qingdaonensis]